MISASTNNIPCFLRYSSIFYSSCRSFYSSFIFNYLFFSFILATYIWFCMFLALLLRSFYSYSRLAASAFILNNSPYSISSLYWLIYCFLTSLCCLRISFSNFFNFSFSNSFCRLSSSSFCRTWFYITPVLQLSLHDRTALSSSKYPTCISLSSAAPIDLAQCPNTTIYYSMPVLSPSLGITSHWLVPVILPSPSPDTSFLLSQFVFSPAPLLQTSCIVLLPSAS